MCCMALSEKAKKRWIDKVRAFKDERGLRYADNEHKRFCESEEKVPYDRVPVFKTDVISLDFPRLGGLYYSRSFIQLAYPVKWEPDVMRINTFSHDLLDPVMQTMPGYVKGPISDLLDMDWHRECLEYLRALSPLQLVVLFDYTLDGYKYTNNAGWHTVDVDRRVEVDDEKMGVPFYEIKSRIWPGAVYLARHGVDGKPFHRLDQGEICRKRADIAELRAALAQHLSKRAGDAKVAIAVNKKLADELVNIAGWKEVIETIATLDERLTDILFLLSKWVCKYLHLNFILNYVLKTYKEEMFRILQEAPAVNREMVVYRGVTDDYYMHTRGRKNVYLNETPISVSLNPTVAIDFLYNKYMSAGWGGRVGNCCLKVIRVMPGTPALAMWPIIGGQQAEILLPPGTTYLISSHRLRPIIAGVPTFTSGEALKSEVCWGEMMKRKSADNKDGLLFPNKWVTEITVDGSAAAIRHANKKATPPAPPPVKARGVKPQPERVVEPKPELVEAAPVSAQSQPGKSRRKSSAKDRRHRMLDFAERAGYIPGTHVSSKGNARRAPTMKQLKEWMHAQGLAKIPRPCPRTYAALQRRQSEFQCLNTKATRGVKTAEKIQDYARRSGYEYVGGVTTLADERRAVRVTTLSFIL
eukprot:jgi/Mesvir1/6938/Mv09091-RA.1